MSLILFRHGETLWNKIKILTGFRDISMNQEGIIQVKNACDRLKKYNFDIVFTSNQKRALESCDIIEQQLNKKFKIIKTDALKERNYGIFTGRYKEELEKLYTKNGLLQLKKSYHYRPVFGESLSDVKIRAGNYFDYFIYPCLQQNKNVLLVSHSNTIRALLVHLKIHDTKSIENIKIPNAFPIQIKI